MAERESSIIKWGKSQGLSEAEAFKTLGEYHDKFQTLYVTGPFITWSEDDLTAHKAFASRFRENPELLRAYNDYRETVAGEDSVVDALESARNSYGIADFFRGVGDLFGGDFEADSFKEILGAYGIQRIGGKTILPYQSKQELEGIHESIKDRGLSDAEVEEEEQQKILDKNEDLKEEERAARAENVFNVDQDPRTAAVRSRVDTARFDPFMFDTGGDRAQINNLLDASSDKIPTPNRGDARSVAKFNNDFKNRQFVKNAAFRKQRELDNLGDDRRDIVDRHFNTMSRWEAVNKGKHPMADKGLENWTDQDKINFVRNYNLGNLEFDDPAPAPAAPAPAAPAPAPAPAPTPKKYPTSNRSRSLGRIQGTASNSAQLPPQDPFKESTKTDAMLTQPKGPESFDLFFAEEPKTEPTSASADSKPFSVNTASASDKFGPRREYIFTDPTRPEKPIEPESFELFMPQNESGFASADSKPFSVDTGAASTDKFGPRREYIFRDPTRPEKPIEPESFELFMPQNESGYASADSKPFSVNTTSASASDKFGPRRDLMTRPFPQPKTEPINPFNITDEDVAQAEKAKETQQNAFTDLEEAEKIESLRNELADVNRQKERALKNASIVQEHAERQAAQKAQLAAIKEGQRLATERHLTNIKNYYNQDRPTYGKRSDGTYGIVYDPRSPQTMKARTEVMKAINNSKSGDPFQDFIDQRLEERERKKKQQAFVAESKASPFYNKSFFG